MWQALLILLLIFTAVILIGLILIQRGKGGGLAGAFGGMGGQSAFGTKAGDTFTKITICVVVIWFLLCILTIKVLKMTEGGGLDVDAGKVSVPGSMPEGAPGAKQVESPTTNNAPSATPAAPATSATPTVPSAPAEATK